jgi:hypothetical protein
MMDSEFDFDGEAYYNGDEPRWMMEDDEEEEDYNDDYDDYDDDYNDTNDF